MSHVHFNRNSPFKRFDRVWLCWISLAGALFFVGYMVGGQEKPDQHQASRECEKSNMAVAMPSQSAHVSNASLITAAEVGNAAEAPADGLRSFRKVLSAMPKSGDWDEMRQLVETARHDPNLRQQLMEEFNKTQDLQSKTKLGVMLSQMNTPDVKKMAETLVAAPDPGKKIDGIRILTNLNQAMLQPGDRQQLMDVLKKESNPEVLQSLILALNPAETTPAQEVVTVIERMSELSKSSSAMVRSAAVASIGRWGEGAAVENVIIASLSDPSPEVTAAAINASSQAGIKTPAVKTLLFQLASQANVDPELRHVAVNALGYYSLDGQEFERLAILRKEFGNKNNM